MLRRVVVSGLLGFVVLVVWGFILNGVFRFNSRINMKQIPDERQVYQTLKETIVEPGRYVVNPELSSSRTFPGEEPVYSILYSGVGHEAAGGLMLFQFLIFLLAPMIAAWMLSLTSYRTLSSYPRKVLFFMGFGLFFALFSDLMKIGIDGYPLPDALILAAHDIILWTLIGVVVAWWLRPESANGYEPITEMDVNNDL